MRPSATSVAHVEAALREAPLPVVARVAQDSLHLDVLALEPEELPLVAESVVWALAHAADLQAGRVDGTAASAPGPAGGTVASAPASAGDSVDVAESAAAAFDPARGAAPDAR